MIGEDTAMYLAIYQNTMLTKGEKSNLMGATDWQTRMNNVIKAYLLLENKDLFQNTYCKFL